MLSKIIINRINIENKCNRALTQDSYKNLAYRNAKTRFVFAKDNLLQEFDNDEITKEILAGPTAESSFLPKGNLVSFLGIPDSESMIAKIRHKLESLIKLYKTPEIKFSQRRIVYSFRVKSLNLQDAYDIVPSPWSTKGIIELIEKGVSNFVAFIYFRLFKKSSRSGHGLQNKNIKTGNSGKVLGIPYLSKILQNFKNRFPSSG